MGRKGGCRRVVLKTVKDDSNAMQTNPMCNSFVQCLDDTRVMMGDDVGGRMKKC